jgi:hypothetical protein
VHLPPEQEADTLAEALATAKGIGNEWWRVRALGALAPYLPPEQKADSLAEALWAAKGIGDEVPVKANEANSETGYLCSHSSILIMRRARRSRTMGKILPG